MIRTFIFIASLALATPGLAQHQRDAHAHDHGAHQHDAHDHSAEAAPPENESRPGAPARLAAEPDILAALEGGGDAAVVDVLGVVCDFCATAMNKTFGKREEVAAVHVDLDAKTLSIVFRNGASLDDEAIGKLVTKAGYKVAAIHRGEDVKQGLTGQDLDNATDSS